MVACDRGRLCKSCFPLLQRDRQTGTSYRYINPGPRNTRAVPISKEKGRFHSSQTHRMHRTQRNGLRLSIMLALRATCAFGWKPRIKVVVVVLLYGLVCTRLHHSKNIKSCIASRRKSKTDFVLMGIKPTDRRSYRLRRRHLQRSLYFVDRRTLVRFLARTVLRGDTDAMTNAETKD